MSARAVSHPRRVLAVAAIACSLPLSALAIQPSRAAAAPAAVLPADAMTEVASVSTLSQVDARVRASQPKVTATLSLDRARVAAGGTVAATVRVTRGAEAAAATSVILSARQVGSGAWRTLGTVATGTTGTARLTFRPSASVIVRAVVVTALGQVPAAQIRLLTVVPTPARPTVSAASRSAVRTSARVVAVSRFSGGVLGLAAALSGRPYQYGAAGPYAFDCSGFTQYVFRHAAGRSLPHNAAAQYAMSVKISRSAIRPGDLIFFTGSGGIYHVGIYAGNGRMYDAQHPGTTTGLHSIFSSSWVAGRIA